MSDNVRRIAASFTGYGLLHAIVRYGVVPQLTPQTFARLPHDSRVEFISRIGSLVNGVVLGSLSLYSVQVRGKFAGDVFTRYPKTLDYLFPAFAGYALYDMIAMATKTRQNASMWLHHLIGFVGASLMPRYRAAAFFPAVFLTPELTLIPGDLLWYMKRFHLQHSPWFNRLLWIRLLGYVLVRWATTIYAVGYALRNSPDITDPQVKQQFPGVVERYTHFQQCLRRYLYHPLADRLARFLALYSKLPWVVSILTTFNVTVLTVLNTYWTSVLLKRLLQRTSLKTA
ncbi:hypothetical protein H4R34_001808 [Dimargaris verticillata]|uniref:TLC domain-containing protein n=1 Tax=Dimargaris verticillata TaxID=2761393 RepID=A0A9W8BAN6_9FUNG|nr:hypothetical protein H4R34_001808 [Dimargaris verticillata]